MFEKKIIIKKIVLWPHEIRYLKRFKLFKLIKLQQIFPSRACKDCTLTLLRKQLKDMSVKSL